MLGLQTPVAPAPPVMSVGGVMPVMSLSQVLEQEKRRTQQTQSAPVVSSLSAYVKSCWEVAKSAKEDSIEPRMFKSLRQRRGEYDPEILSTLKATGGSEIYMMLTAVKCRAAGAWLREALLAARDEKPWTLTPTKVPALAPQDIMALREQAINQLATVMLQTGIMPSPAQQRTLLENLRDEFMSQVEDAAIRKVERMEGKMEDQLSEGGFQRSLHDFIEDLVTFPAAFMKGPVVRRKPQLGWIQTGNTYELDYSESLVLEWERVSPFDVYPSPGAEAVDDGFLIHRHRLRRVNLQELIGVEGYDDGAIRLVLDEYGKGGLYDWLSGDTERAESEGKSSTDTRSNPEELIDALQFWGPVQGKMLQEWGLEDGVEDPLKDYHCEIWLIGSYVIKATVNYDPLGRRPYFKASYENIPGSFWGNSVADLCRDTQNMCNAAARALANNMGISSGPQVEINIDRLPPGEDVTQMFPWKIWQVTSDPTGSTAPALKFFQPGSNAQELMAIYEKFSVLADEYTGIPRYMTGDSPAGGAGRTASGMSMLMSNASKSIKQVLINVDMDVLKPALERLYFYNMKYSDDPELKGDVQVIARGSVSIMLKESAQVRRNEFLATTANPIDMSIIGMEGRAEVLRQVAETLDLKTDKVVPSEAQLRLRQMAQLAYAQAGQAGGPTPSGQNLQDGSPVTDNFSPARRQ